VIASAASAALKRQRQGEMPELDARARDEPMLASVDALLQDGSLSLADLRETRQLQITGPADGENYFVTFSPLNFSDWVVATVIPASDFLASIERSAMMLLIALAGLTVIVAAIAILSANRLVTAPLLRIAGQLKHIEDFRLDRVRRVASPLRELDDLSGVLLQMSRGLASFQKYMPTELVRTLVSQGVGARPGGHQQTLTVMFTDVAGFTGLSEELGDRVARARRVSGSGVEGGSEPLRYDRQVYRRWGDGILGFDIPVQSGGRGSGLFIEGGFATGDRGYGRLPA
jgi:adenylate cyclase